MFGWFGERLFVTLSECSLLSCRRITDFLSDRKQHIICVPTGVMLSVHPHLHHHLVMG